MKIVCDNCATKYQIADEKVSGKAFKIRCKKCGHVIVVGRTTAPASAPAGGDAPAEAPAAASGTRGWRCGVAPRDDRNKSAR